MAEDVQLSPMQQIVVDAALEHGVNPALALALTHVESGFDPAARNPVSKVTGLMQVTNDTGGRYGQTPETRTDPVVSARAGTRYFRDLLDQNQGNVEQSLVQYNGNTDPQYVHKVYAVYPQYAKYATMTRQAAGTPTQRSDVASQADQLQRDLLQPQSSASVPTASTVSSDADRLQQGLVPQAPASQAPPQALAPPIVSTGPGSVLGGEVGRVLGEDAGWLSRAAQAAQQPAVSQEAVATGAPFAVTPGAQVPGTPPMPPPGTPLARLAQPGTPEDQTAAAIPGTKIPQEAFQKLLGGEWGGSNLPSPQWLKNLAISAGIDWAGAAGGAKLAGYVDPRLAPVGAVIGGLGSHFINVQSGRQEPGWVGYALNMLPLTSYIKPLTQEAILATRGGRAVSQAEEAAAARTSAEAAQTAAQRGVADLPERYMPARPPGMPATAGSVSEYLYDTFTAKAGKLPVDPAPAQTMATTVETQLGGHLPSLGVPTMERVVKDIQAMTPATTAGEIHQAIKDLRPYTLSSNPDIRGSAKQLTLGLHKTLEASIPAEKVTLDAAAAAYRREQAVDDLRQMTLPGSGVLKHEGGILQLNSDALQDGLEHLINHEPYFKGTWTPAELQSLREDVAAFANTPKLPEVPGAPQLPPKNWLATLGRAGGAGATALGASGGDIGKAAVVTGGILFGEGAEAVFSHYLMSPQGQRVVRWAMEPNGTLNPAKWAMVNAAVEAAENERRRYLLRQQER